MATIEITGRITEDGKLEAELPPNTPPGEVDIVIKPHEPQTATTQESESFWTPEELEEMLAPVTPMSGKQIVEWLEAGGLGEGAWDDPRDGATWVEEERAKRRERSKW